MDRVFQFILSVEGIKDRRNWKVSFVLRVRLNLLLYFLEFTFIYRAINHKQIYNTLQPRSPRTKIDPGSDPAPREDLRSAGRLLSRSLARRCWKIREIIVTSAGHPIHRIKVSGVPVLLQNDRRRADRRFPRGDARVTIGPLGAKGVPRLGAHRFIKEKNNGT